MQWTATKKGWVNASVFKDWIVGLNNKMKAQNRKIIMFLDNFSGHILGAEDAEDLLTNVRVEWLPANCTSLIQPVDQGIGNALKVRYRKFLHEHMARMVMADQDPMTMLDILKMCQWLGKAWNSLHNTRTVRRCFEKAGFIMNGEEPVVLPPEDAALQNEGEFDKEATVLLAEEAEIAVPPEVKDSEQWIGDAMETMAGGEADSVGEPTADDEEEPEPSPITARQAADRAAEIL